MSGVTAAFGAPPGRLSRMEKPLSPSSSSGSAVTRSTLASGGASAVRRASRKSIIAATEVMGLLIENIRTTVSSSKGNAASMSAGRTWMSTRPARAADDRMPSGEPAVVDVLPEVAVDPRQPPGVEAER